MYGKHSAHAQLFRFARKKLHYSQARLGKKLGIDQSTVCRVEQGLLDPQHHWLAGLEQLTGMSLQELTLKATGALRSGNAPAPAAGVSRWQLLPTNELKILHFRTGQKLGKLRKALARKQNALQSAIAQNTVGESALDSIGGQLEHWQTALDIVRHNLPANTFAGVEQCIERLKQQQQQQAQLNRCTTSLSLAEQELEVEMLADTIAMQERQLALMEEALQQRTAAEKAATATLRGSDAPQSHKVVTISQPHHVPAISQPHHGPTISTAPAVAADDTYIEMTGTDPPQLLLAQKLKPPFYMLRQVAC